MQLIYLKNGGEEMNKKNLSLLSKLILLITFFIFSLPSNAGMITKAVGAYVAYKVITKNKEEKEQKQQSASEDHYRYSSDEECVVIH
ncbi:hypothetical protein NYR30_09805 [Gallibacterium salpingitidis]|uniref:hypothetical protein n=1 Tax=Gallibacterium salpingitidis TaxID=505341 RepID=UPI0026703E5A|nr:hypothetical protein [Gallibacterium salpingitidis]WKS99034.1 hypothetical protein NYR30_09805 [Gallibacterium salpingitidis]